METAQQAPSRRWRREDWIDLAMTQLRAEGIAALTLERLCADAGRTRGSFYHHFESVDRLLAEVALRWRATETDAIAENVLETPDPEAGLALLVKRTDAIDHRLERGVRILAVLHHEIRQIVEQADIRREVVMAEMLRRAYRLDNEDAKSASRLFHALHHTAVMRSPDDIKAYSRETIRSLLSWLPVRPA